MSEALRDELQDVESSTLYGLANKDGITREEQTARLIEAYFDTSSQDRDMEVSAEFLRENADPVLDTVAQGLVYVRAENGRAFVIILKDTYDRLSDPD
ncbi:hypothetical protein R1T40_19275 [Tritonibacter scottomollicae]|uniref:Uncharacterized protein n=1 Tax=Tritonibacter scottomollicae TaxID=483013 RepID=A0ABZ0HE01_TRISK|nr:hypothetical protein [Tritonibacter scottomollicae]WOI33053.1 hypothetical protein R1T40_19275 [Tritonibacter scottomollicae]